MGTCSALREGIEAYKTLGLANIYEELNSHQLPQLFTRDSVVILFAHWVPPHKSEITASVEFWDTRLSLENFLDAIPSDYVGILDLSVCHPTDLVDLIAKARPRCRVSYIPFEVSPTVWSEIYATVFQTLALFGAEYVDVLSKVVNEYRRQSLKRRRV
jgi:hypothetical protein